MKKTVLTLIFALILFSFPQTEIFYAKCQTKNFARITKSNIYFYQSPIDTEDNKLFCMENSYFVELLEPEEKGFYRAKYKDLEGYVRASDLVFVSGSPQVPYPENINFRVFALSGLNLRSTPIESTGPFNIITKVPYLETNLVFYGLKQGEEVISHKGNQWYYCKYISEEEEYVGYVYSVFCDMLANAPINTEQLDTTDKPIFEEPSAPTINTNDTIATLSKPAQYVIIGLVCLPCLLIVYLLFKPTKISVEENKKKKKKIRKLRKSDYYEFDDYN